MLDDRKLVRPLRVAIVVSFVVMIAATFAPVSLFQSLDRWIALCVVVIRALVATASLIEVRPRLTPCASLAAAMAALALCMFDGVDEWGRVVGGDAQGPPMELTPHGPVPFVPAGVLNPPVHLDFGFSVFIAAAVVAAIAALLLVGIVDRRGPLSTHASGSTRHGRTPAPTPS